MNPFNFNSEKLNAELQELLASLSQGVEAMQGHENLTPGASEKECVFQQDKVRLYRYSASTEKLECAPLLIVYALVNRPYMTDLQDGRSLVQGLLETGVDVYLVDWGYPDRADVDTSLHDYINIYLDNCVTHICEEHGIDKLNLLGICQGGVFSLCYTALRQERIKNLVTTVTPVDFHTDDDLLSHLVRHIDIDLCVDTFGNIPGSFLNTLFLSLKPYRLMGQKYVDMLDILGDPDRFENFIRMEKWINDCPDQAGQAFREFVTQCYQGNRLVKGSLEIGSETVDLEDIDIPVLNIFARDDHLVPPDSSKALAGCVSSKDYSEIEFPGGHIGIYVSSKSREMLPPAISQWLLERK